MRGSELRIYIKLNNGRNYKIPAPMGLLKMVIGLGGFGMLISKKYVSIERRIYLDSIDFEELKKSLDVLESYKRLKLVEIKSGDGTEVEIII